MSKFKVGDIVTGVEGSKYRITNSHMTKAEVIHTEDGYISVKVLSYDGEISGTFVGDQFPSLEAKYFKLVTPFNKYIKGVKAEMIDGKAVVTIEDRIVIAIPTDSIGISSVIDGEVFVKEIGEALAYYREQTGGSK